jgi:hypothetical protein
MLIECIVCASAQTTEKPKATWESAPDGRREGPKAFSRASAHRSMRRLWATDPAMPGSRYSSTISGSA